MQIEISKVCGKWQVRIVNEKYPFGFVYGNYKYKKRALEIKAALEQIEQMQED